MLLQLVNMSEANHIPKDLSFQSYLTGRFHSLPDTEVADDPGQKKAQAKVPLNASNGLYAGGYS